MPRRDRGQTKTGARTATGEIAARNGHTGRPSQLTDRTADAIVHAVLDGNHLTVACNLAHISRSTLYRWMEAADNVEEAIENGKPYDEGALAYLAFRDRLLDARAQAEAMAVSIVRKQMVGGYVTHERPLQDTEGNVMYDSNTGQLIVERTTAPPDGRLALSYLARSRPADWSLASAGRMEVTGAGGGPVQHEVGVTADVISSLAAQVAAVAARNAEDGMTASGEEIYDAEVVEDGSGEDG